MNSHWEVTQQINRTRLPKCLVLIPAGPDLRNEYVQDTLDSVAHYMPPDETGVCLLDDTEDGQFRDCKAGALRLWYVSSAAVYRYQTGESRWGALWIKQIRTLLRMRARFDYSIVFRLDTDAVVTGPAPHRDVARFVTPTIGIVGAFRRRGDGSIKRERPAGKALLSEMEDTDRRLIVRNSQLRRLYDRAVENGYRLGMNCTGGSFFLMRGVVDRMAEIGVDKYDGLALSHIGEDHLFGLATYAAGYRLVDAPDDLMAVNWRGLPMAPEEAARREIKVFHPVKSPADPTVEGQVRAVFRAIRLANQRT